MNIKSALLKTSSVLSKKGIDHPVAEAEMLLSFVIGHSKEYFYSHPEDKISIVKRVYLQKLILARLMGWSVAHLVGKKGFYGFDFMVDKHTLIPRPETELMVEKVLDMAKRSDFKMSNFIDIGTGSGCIIISLAKEFKKINFEGNFFGLDISKPALSLAKKNAKELGVDGCIKFLHSDLLNNINLKEMKGGIVMMANLPYLTPKQVKDSPSIKKEPKSALVSGEEGLDHYQRLLKQIKNLRIDRDMVLLCEIDDSQKESFPCLVGEILPLWDLEMVKDLSGFERLAVLSNFKILNQKNK